MKGGVAIETHTCNNRRLQPVMIELGNASNPTADYCMVYNYYTDQSNPAACAVPAQGSHDNGDAIGYLFQDNINPTYFSRAESFTYDTLDRMTNAVSTGIGSGANYNLTFGYDAYGNMTCQTNGQTNGPCPNYSFNEATNQINSPGFSYDADGNMTADGSHSYQYDAEGHLVSIDNGSTASYTYNAQGQQVEVKFSYQLEYPYDPQGRLMGTYSAGEGRWWGGNVWWGGRTLTRASASDFQHENAVGTSTMTTLANGSIGIDELMYPWGQVWAYIGTAYGAYFGGLLGNPEPPQNLYPAQNRIYDNFIGHWFTPDPTGGNVADPQSLNRYAYALNNPTTLTDPSGLGDPDCNNPEYASSHAECPAPPCVAEGTEGCIPYPIGYPVGGGGGGSAPTTTTTGATAITTAGDDFIHNPLPCLTPAQQGVLANFLLGAAAALLHLPPSQVQAAKVKALSVHGGALNVQIAIPPGDLSVSPDVIANAGRSNPIFEPHDPFEIRKDEIVPVGPGTSVHVVFNTTTNAAGRTVISDARVHADIGNPDSGAGGVLRHVLLDFAAASVFSAAQQGMPGGVQGCPVKFQ